MILTFIFHYSQKSQILLLGDKFDKYGPWTYREMKSHSNDVNLTCSYITEHVIKSPPLTSSA